MGDMSIDTATDGGREYGSCRLTVELTNRCNLQCSYCVRDDEALHALPAQFLDVDLLSRIARDARDAMGIEHVAFTGGEPTLHPRFGDVLACVGDLSLSCSFVTNGWLFDRVWPSILEHRSTVTHVSFSLDGATRESHDRWRGAGSFDRVIRAFSRCWVSQIPFHVKVVLRRDTVPALERVAMLAARLGAELMSVGHLMPTSPAEAREALTVQERADAEREVAALAQVLKMRIGLDVGYWNTARITPCAPLAGVSANVDWRGRVTLCCNLSGYRGGVGDLDVVADLNHERFDVALDRLRRIASDQAARRARELDSLERLGRQPGLERASPCLFCLCAFGKAPWMPMASIEGGVPGEPVR